MILDSVFKEILAKFPLLRVQGERPTITVKKHKRHQGAKERERRAKQLQRAKRNEDSAM